MKSVEVLPVKEDRTREAVYRLRYSVYVEEMGWPTRYACPAKRTLTDTYDRSGAVFAASVGDEVVGTLRTHHSGREDLGEYADLYQLQEMLCAKPGGVGIATMFMVRKAWRWSRVAWALMTAAFRTAIAHGVEMIVIDCVPEMVPFYSKLGFSVHVPSIVHPEYGPGVCMAVATQNCRVVRAVSILRSSDGGLRSPLCRG